MPDRAWQRLRRLRRGRPGLTELARRHGTDKWGAHRYTPHYERHLAHLRDASFTLLEIGIGGYRHEGQGGASLRMWKDWLPRAQVVGLDIADKTFVEEERIRTYVGSQTDPDVLQQIAADHPDLRVVVDDGSHVNEHVRTTFALLFPLLPEGGIYAIEDTQTSYWATYGGNATPGATGTIMALVKDLLDGLNYEEFTPRGYQPTATELGVTAVHCYHNLVVLEKGRHAEARGRRRPAAVRAAAERGG